MQFEPQVTSSLLWRGVLLAAPLDCVLVFFLARRIRAQVFRRLRWPITATMTLFFAALWGLVFCYLYWEPVYHYFFPAWSRWLLPFVYGAGFGCFGLLSWWLALHLRGNVVVNFCILVGVWGMVGHAWAIHRGLLEKPRMLRGASPEAVLFFSGFEFVFYACVILAIAALLHGARRSGSRAAGVGC